MMHKKFVITAKDTEGNNCVLVHYAKDIIDVQHNVRLLGIKLVDNPSSIQEVPQEDPVIVMEDTLHEEEGFEQIIIKMQDSKTLKYQEIFVSKKYTDPDEFNAALLFAKIAFVENMDKKRFKVDVISFAGKDLTN